MVRLVLPRRGGGHIHCDVAPGVGAASEVLFPGDGPVDEQLLEMIARGIRGEVVPLAEAEPLAPTRHDGGRLADPHEVARLGRCAPRVAQFTREDRGRVIQNGPGAVQVLTPLRVGHHHAINDLAVVLHKPASDFAEVHQRQEDKARIDAFSSLLQVADGGRRKDLMVGVEVINHPAGQVGVCEREARDFLRPAPVVQPKRLGVEVAIQWRAFGGRDQIDPDLEVGLRGFGQEQLQVVPIRRQRATPASSKWSHATPSAGPAGRRCPRGRPGGEARSRSRRGGEADGWARRRPDLGRRWRCDGAEEEKCA